MFGDGIYEVGNGPGQIKPGKYHTNGPTNSMGMGYWARLKDTSGDMNSIITNDIVKGPATITIKSSDAAIKISDLEFTAVK